MHFEKWDIFDENGNFSGKTIIRNKAQLKPGEYHLVVHIWVVSRDGRALIQRRAETKREMPGIWAANGGCAVAGESSFDAAKRELEEELGIVSDETTLKKVLRLKKRNSLVDIWMIVTDISVEDLTLQESEVAEAKWVTVGELKDMVRTGKYHNYSKGYFDIFFKTINNPEGVLE